MVHTLATLASRLLHNHGTDLAAVTVLFPNRRAGFTLRHELATQAGGALWLPQIDTLSAWLQQLDPYPQADALTLQLLLWELAGQPQDFAVFLPQAAQLLALFDEIDAALAPPQRAFALLPEAGWTAPELERPHEQHYLQLLAQAAQLYAALNDRLDQTQLSYPGRTLRRLATQPEAFLPGGADIYLWGMDELKPAEVQLLLWLQRHAQLHLHWDLDRLYLQADYHAAGHFFRRLQQQAPPLANYASAMDGLHSSPCHIHLVPVANATTQAAALGHALHRRLAELAAELPANADAHQWWGQRLRRIAVVLPDEGLLLPLLNALPATLPRLNVAMGYPARQAPLHSLLHTWATLHLEHTPQGFYHRHLLALLAHPLLQPHLGTQPDVLRHHILQHNLVYVQPPQGLVGVADLLLQVPEHGLHWLALARQLAHWLGELTRVEGADPDPFHTEYLRLLQGRLDKLEQLLAHSPELHPADLFRLMLTQMEALSLPFSGEPLAGLQVLGMLETRVLDFDEVHILGANEELLPPRPAADSLLLPATRQLVGLPTPADVAARYSYLFWRLVQHAHRVHLYYTVGDGAQAEPSRFIHQIKMDWARHNPQVTVTEAPFLLAAQPAITPHPAAPAGAEPLWAALPRTPQGLPYLSPSAMGTYLSCSLRYALRYIYKLKPEEEVTEDPDTAEFGTLVHKALELLYSPWLGVELTRELLEKELTPARVAEAVQQAYITELGPESWPPTGKALLNAQIIGRLLEKVVANDVLRAPFAVLALEQPLQRSIATPMGDLLITGNADRIDRTAEGIVIIDYKTGKVEANKLKCEQPLELLLLREHEARTQAVQGLAYAWMYSPQGPVAAVGFYRLKAQEPEIVYMPHELTDEVLNETGKLFASIVEEMMSQPFEQAREARVCTYCDYVQLCQRDII